MEKIIEFFGYGANADIHTITNIIGHEPKGGEGAVLQGYGLAIQTLSNIPEKERNILKKVWGENFQAYTLITGPGFVKGRRWFITEEDLEKIQQWEFAHKDGWREIISIKITTADGKTADAITEKSRDNFPVEKIIDGLNHENILNKEGKIYYSKEDENKIEFMREQLKEYYGQYINA